MGSVHGNVPERLAVTGTSPIHTLARLADTMPAMHATVLLLVGCSGFTSTGALPMVSGPGFFDRPFPSAERMVDGRPDLSDFPGQDDYPIIAAYTATADQLDGFGTNAPLYVRFEEPVDTALLPSPEESVLPESPVLLLDVDRDSPTRGEAVPLDFEWVEGATQWQPGNLLAIAPVWGFPLRPGTEYALVLRAPIARKGAQGDVWGVGGDAAYAATEETLLALGIDPVTVSLAVPFPTQDPLAEMRRIADTIHGGLGMVPLAQELEYAFSRDEYDLWVGWVTLPIWQHGERPYREEGGEFRFDEDGTPVLAGWERVRFALSVPTGMEMPEGGWPTVLYSHGTGGDYLTFCNSGSSDEEATVMARQGIAVIGVSQPLHGDRATPDTSPEYDSFNYTNPDAGRSNFRQGALDQVFLARLLTREAAEFDAGGETVRLDPARVAFFGHSQGGLVGAMAAPFFSRDLVAAGFSGTGGGLSMTVQLRKDPLDIEALLVAMLDFEDEEVLTTSHPIVALIQTLSEATDPLNYAPWWFAEDPGLDARPIPILLTEGLKDEYTPSVTTEALAAAGRVPIVGDAATDPKAMELRRLETTALPTRDNARDWNAARITAGLGQFPDDGHFAIYDNQSAKVLYRDFFVTALDGEPALGE